jgi:hypothetical protein
MRTILAAAALLGLAAVAAPAMAQPQDVLAPGRAGQLQCFSPNVLRKTCGAISSFRLRADGSYENQSQVLVARQPFIVMTSSSPVSVRNGAVCGPVTTAHLQAAEFTIDGLAATGDNVVFLREQVAQMPGFLGEEVCTTYTTSADGLRAEFTINGARNGDASQVIWVRADEGYRVAP